MRTKPNDHFTLNSAGLQFFIPIIAVVVVCGALFFWRGAPDEDEYLHSALDLKREAERCKSAVPITHLPIYLPSADMAEKYRV